MGPAFGVAAFEVGAGPGLPAALDDRDLVQRGVQFAVAVAVEAVAALLPRGGVDGCGTGEPCELRLVAEAGDASGLADQLAGDQHAAALQLEQLWRAAGDEHRDLAL